MDIYKGAEKVVKMCANVQPGEKVVVVTDIMRAPSIAENIAKAARALGANVVEVSFDGELIGGEMRTDISHIIETADVLICVTTRTLAYTRAVAICRENGGRILVMTEATEETLITGAVEADFLSLAPVVSYVKECFDKAETVTVSAPGGTRIHLSVKERKAATCTSIVHNPGDFSGFPNVEVYIAPIEKETRGLVVADATSSRIGLLDEPITLEISDGRIASINGGSQSDSLREILDKANCDNAYVLCEFALGLNPFGTLVGNIISDEGLYGTGHFGFGNNLSFGGVNRSSLHLDLVYKKPTVYLDGTCFMKDGMLCDFEFKQLI